MTEALAAPTTPAAAPAEAPAPRPSVDERAASLKASLDTSPEPAEPAAETSEVASPPSGDGASPSAADSAGSDEAAKARAERLARIAKVRAKENALDEERQRRSVAKKEAGEVEKLRARLKEVEPLEQVFSSEEALLEMAEKKGMTAEKLVAWMRQRLTDPQAIAAQKAKSEADRVREEMEARIKAMEEQAAAREAEANRAKQEAQAVARATTFVQQAASSEKHPLTQAFLKKHGANGLVAFANHFITPLLPEHYELGELHDHIEQFLDEVSIAPTATTAASQPSTKKNGAEKPVTTLSNALGSERATAVEEIPLHKLPREERARRLKEKLANE